MLAFDEFEAVLDAHFIAEDLAQLDRRRLHSSYVEFSASEAGMLGLAALFRADNAFRLVGGMQWWEQRVGQRSAEMLCMWLATSKTTPRILPRLYTPLELVGSWRLVAGYRRNNWQPVDPRLWTLKEDARFIDSDHPERVWLWRVHLGDSWNLWLGPSRCRTKETFWIRSRSTKALELCASRGRYRRYRWVRVS